jgi:hypothetical protein
MPIVLAMRAPARRRMSLRAAACDFFGAAAFGPAAGTVVEAVVDADSGELLFDVAPRRRLRRGPGRRRHLLMRWSW